MELLGPEYAIQINSLDVRLQVFFSRKDKRRAGVALVEKQNAEVGLMPVVADEENEYGYTGENRHMVKSFLKGLRPSENFRDGLNVTELLMAAYMSAEREKTLAFPPPGLANFVPAVAKGTWNPKKNR